MGPWVKPDDDRICIVIARLNRAIQEAQNKTMNILQILPEMNVGGVETGTLDFGKYLVEHGHKSVVISNGGVLVKRLKAYGVRHYTLPVHRKSIWGLRVIIKQVRVIIQKEKIDIVHARSRVPAWIAYFACQGTKARFVTTCHGYYRNPWFSRVMGFGRLVIVPSGIIGKHMKDTFKVLPENIRCIPRSVDVSRFTYHEERWQKAPFTIAMIGRMTTLKGHTYFLKAIGQLVQSRQDIQVQIIGDAPQKKPEYRQALEQEVRQLGLENVVTFLGNRQDIPELLSKVDVLVMASIYPESFGRVIVEAQAAGVAVVATEVGGVVDIIEHERTGLLVPPQDPAAIAQAVNRLLNDRAATLTMVRQAHEKLRKEFILEVMAERTLKVYDEVLTAQRILVIKLRAMGDVVLITASLKALRAQYPQAHVACLIGKISRQILAQCPTIDELITFDEQGRDRGWFGVGRAGMRLRQHHFDQVIDFQNNRKSHALAYLSGAAARYGYRRKWGGLLTHTVVNPRHDIAAVAHQFQVLNMMGLKYRDDMRLELWPSVKDKEYARALFQERWVAAQQQVVGINLAASDKWPTKNWSVASMAALCDQLSAMNIRVVLTGMAKDQPLADALMSLTQAQPLSVVGKTDIMQLAAVIAQCACYVTPDSAPMHVAAAMNVPCVVVFGPTDAQRHVPPADHLTVIQKDLTCAPCYRRHCRILTHACMQQITPEEVFKAVKVFMVEAT